MHYKVFLDTNIYDTANFSFRNGLFSQLRNYAKSGVLELQINSVVKKEVQRHISKRIKDTTKNLKQILTCRDLQLFRTVHEYEERMQILEPSIWVNTAMEEFDKLLCDCKIEEISLNGIDIEGVLDDYFEMRYPFEEAKKDEFPDAIIVRSIAWEIERLSKGQNWFPDYNFESGVADDLIYCIVSEDKGFRKAIERLVGNRPNEDVKTFTALNELINFFAIQDEKAAELQAKLDNGFAKSLITTTIDDGISSVAFNVEDPNGYVDDVSNHGTCNYEYSAFVLGLQKMSNGLIVARIYLDVQFDVHLEYEFLNETESCWDREDHVYLWTVRTEKEAVFRGECSMIFSMCIDQDDDVEFNDYIELPSDIEVYESDMLELISCESTEPY